jgi:hypothetical protein
MRTVDDRLEEVIALMNFRLYHEADAKVDAIYGDLTNGDLEMTEAQEELMFDLIDRLSTILYG